MRLKPGRPSPALVVACIAFVIALGPVVKAANTVFTTDIVDGEVKAEDIADAAITSGKFAADAVTGAALADNSVATAHVSRLAITHAKIAANAVTSGNVLNEALTSADLRGADLSGPFSIAAGAVGIGRCRDLNIAVAGARAGEVAVLSLQGVVSPNMLIEAVRVPSTSVVTVKVCNFTGASSPAISNLPIRIMTFG